MYDYLFIYNCGFNKKVFDHAMVHISTTGTIQITMDHPTNKTVAQIIQHTPG